MAIIGPVGNETTARAYSQRGHGNKASRSKGRIHISDFQRTCITGIANSSRYIHGGSLRSSGAAQHLLNRRLDPCNGRPFAVIAHGARRCDAASQKRTSAKSVERAAPITP